MAPDAYAQEYFCDASDIDPHQDGGRAAAAVRLA
jgi:hypothetical protein